MDFGFGHHLDGLRRRVSERIRQLRKNDSGQKRISPRLKGGIFGAGFILISGILAWSAHELTYSHALTDWEQSRLPSDRTWSYSLAKYGWASPQITKIVHQALKKLPASIDTAGSVWASPSLDWLVVFADPNQTMVQKVFCRDCSKIPERWDPLGTGWTAFDQVMARLEKIQSTPRVSPKVKKVMKFVDSREIHY
jgi:hypothetical protein